MSEALLAVALLAALACPLHMMRHARRRGGAGGGCCGPRRELDAAALHARLQAVAEELARRQSADHSAVGA